MVNYEDIVDIYTVLGTHSVGMVLSTPLFPPGSAKPNRVIAPHANVFVERFPSKPGPGMKSVREVDN